MTPDFICEGCGIGVFNMVERASSSGMCVQCEWLCEHVPDPVEMHEVRALLGGVYPHMLERPCR